MLPVAMCVMSTKRVNFSKHLKSQALKARQFGEIEQGGGWDGEEGHISISKSLYLFSNFSLNFLLVLMSARRPEQHVVLFLVLGPSVGSLGSAFYSVFLNARPSGLTELL